MKRIVDLSAKALNRCVVLQQVRNSVPQPESNDIADFAGWKPTPQDSAGWKPALPRDLTTLAELPCDGPWQHFGVADKTVIVVGDRAARSFLPAASHKTSALH